MRCSFAQEQYAQDLVRQLYDYNNYEAPRYDVKVQRCVDSGEMSMLIRQMKQLVDRCKEQLRDDI